MTEQDDFFRLPDLGEGLTDAEIVNWLVDAGDRVVANQPLVTVETDKAVVDVPSPRTGVIAERFGDVGDVVEVGSPLVRFSAEGARPDAGAVVGALPAGPEAPVGRPTPRPERPASAVPASTPARGAGVHASPRARQLARVRGVDLAGIVGSGPEGVIQVRDVEGTTASGKPAGGERLTGVRRAMARRMADASARVARASVTGEADISRWQHQGSPLRRLIRAIGVAAEAEPLLNAWYDDEANACRLNPTVDLGIAMETADGLFVPVLKDVARRGADALAHDLAQIERQLADRSIGPASLRGQTISLSNFGAVGGMHAEMVVVPPQVAIVGAGRAFERLVPAADGYAVARILPLSVSFDHRAVTGVETCRFLNVLIEDLAGPE